MKNQKNKFLYLILIFGILPFLALAGGGDNSENPTGGFGIGEAAGAISSDYNDNPKGGFGDGDFEILAPPPPPDEPIPFEGAGLVIFLGLILGGKKILRKKSESAEINFWK
jgi:hypothetical protein